MTEEGRILKGKSPLEAMTILVLGSGPIRIGQAAEFDYSGSQACRTLKEEGHRVILLNSNPATIQTDLGLADVVYLRPLTVDVVEDVLREQRPQGVIATLGGQTALNLLVELDEKGLWERYGVKVLGTSVESVRRSEGRLSFRDVLSELGEPVVESAYAASIDEALAFAADASFPLVVRPDYTLGGTGGGVARDGGELARIAREGLAASPVGRVLVERYLEGWREIEVEVVRDGWGNALAVCSMENFDGMGIHTGDSIVVAPVLTLTDGQWQRLRSSALRIVEGLAIEGACNVQFAFSPDGSDYAVIEVNPRASRSSALASKATGYPIARMAARIALGQSLAEMANPVTGQGSALAEPVLDYVVVKFPRWPFDRFPQAAGGLGTRMKSTGEVMALGLHFNQALQKALRSLELPFGLRDPLLASFDDEALLASVEKADHRRLWAFLELLRRGRDPKGLADRGGVHPFFLSELARLVDVERRMALEGAEDSLLRQAKYEGFSDDDVARCVSLPVEEVEARRRVLGLERAFREVDGCAGETPTHTGYYYGVFGAGGDVVPVDDRPSALVLGSGPIRIGQGIEFDYCCVKAAMALRKGGLRALMVNNNPETVSTDHDLSDGLYFEPLTVEDVLPVIERERPLGVLAAFGGQSALKLGLALEKRGVSLLGTTGDVIRSAEDRGLFSSLLEDLGIPQPPGVAAESPDEARQAARSLGYPLMVRPSFVIGGVAMRLCFDERDFEEIVDLAFSAEKGQSVLIDRFLQGREFEVDALCDGEDVFLPGIFEHLEPAGIHSGDSMALFPDISLTAAQRREMVETVQALSAALGVKGLMNVQFVLHEGRLYVIEANPRASRTVPIAAKLTGIPLVEMAVRLALGAPFSDLGLKGGLHDHQGPRGVKVPVFSTEKLPGVDAQGGVRMQSTGEALGLGDCIAGALMEALAGAGWKIPRKGRLLLSLADRAKHQAPALAAAFSALGWELEATAGTAALLSRWGLTVSSVEKGASLVEAMAERRWDLVVNVPGEHPETISDGFRLRRAAVESSILCLHTVETALALAVALAATEKGRVGRAL